MVAVLVSGDVSVRKPVNCSDGVGIPLTLAFLGAFYRKVCWGGGLPLSFRIGALVSPSLGWHGREGSRRDKSTPEMSSQ